MSPNDDSPISTGPASPSLAPIALPTADAASAGSTRAAAATPCCAQALGNVQAAMVGGQHHRIIDARCGRAARRNRRGRGRARAAAGTSPARRCHSCGRHSRSPRGRSTGCRSPRRGPAASPGSGRRRARASRRRTPARRGSALASPAARAKRPAPTGLPPPSIGTTRALAVHKRRRDRAAACGAAIAAATAVLTARQRLRDGAPASGRWRTPCRPNTSAGRRRWPPIITAARSLPATATLRLAGVAPLQQIAERRHLAGAPAKRCSWSTTIPATRSSSAQ